MAETIQSLIDKSLIRPDRVRSGKWNPSSFGSCFRKQFWNRKDEPKSNPSDERDIRIFAAGQLFHDLTQEAIIGYYGRISWQKEVLVESDDIKGFADLVSENEVVEIKSQHSKSFWYMAKFKGDDIKKEKYSNWLQVGYYARELKKKFMRLVFVSKDDLCIQEYVQPLDKYWLSRIHTELLVLRAFWKQQELPPAKPRCEPNKKGEYWECNYCAWLKLCNAVEGYGDKEMYSPEITKRAKEILNGNLTPTI